MYQELILITLKLGIFTISILKEQEILTNPIQVMSCPSIMKKRDKWSHIPNNHNLFTQNAIINNLTKIDNYLVFSTIDGVLFYDTKNEKWFHEYNFTSKNNRSIWKILNHNNKLFIATSNGGCYFKLL